MNQKTKRRQDFKEIMAEILERCVEFPPGTLVTVADARLAPNQANAHIRLSVLPNTQGEATLKAVAEFNAEIKKALAKNQNLRKIPKLFWSLDETEEKAEKLETFINRLQKEGEL